MIIVLLGSPGSGKGTQSKILSERLGLEHLATGDIFRSEMAAKTPLGLKAAGYVNAGKLVPDSIVTEMVAKRLESKSKDYLLDGFPRNLEQAKELSRLLSLTGRSVDLAIFLNLPRAEALRRLTSRLVCAACGEVFNAVTRPPKISERCDRCGGSLTTRQDDQEATASRRLMVFEDLTQPLVSYYKTQGDFEEINAAQSLEAVASQLEPLIKGSRVKN